MARWAGSEAAGAGRREACVVELVSRYTPGGLVVDLGCSTEDLADPLSEAGFTYVAAGSNKALLDDLRTRGFEAHDLEVGHSERLAESFVEMADERRVGAVVLLDVIDRVPDADSFLAALRDVMAELGRPVLVVSVPNVAHLDIGAKLLAGRWDPTFTGLLDRDRSRSYTEHLLVHELERHGWRQLDRADVSSPVSDQHFPADHPVLVGGTPLRDFLAALRRAAGDNASVTHFVRALALTDAPAPVEPLAPDPPYLSVLVATDGESPARLSELMTCIAAQSCDDLEVVVVVDSPDEGRLSQVGDVISSFGPELASRARVARAEVPGAAASLNQAIGMARGTYLCFPQVGDLLSADWASTFVEATRREPGRVVRARTLSRWTEPLPPSSGAPAYETLSRPFAEHPDRFDLVAHLAESLTPLRSLAFPAGLCRHLSLRLDPSLPEIADWDFLLRAVLLAGVTDANQATSLGDRRRDVGTAEGDPSQKGFLRRLVLERLSEQPSVLPAGLLSEVAGSSPDTIERESRARQEQYERSLRAELDRTRGLVEGALAASRKELESTVARAGAAVTDARRQLSDAEAYLNGVRSQLAEARMDNERMRWELERLRRHTEEMAASRWWRLGRPFRWMGRGLRSLLGGSGPKA